MFTQLQNLIAAVSMMETPEKFVLPDGFVYLTDIVPDVVLEIRYFSSFNFIGTRVDYYQAPTAIISEQAAAALKQVSDYLRPQGYILKIFDAYRPQGAVDHFMRWIQDENDAAMKPWFFPDITKNRLVPEGYIASRCSHSRGSAVDLTLISMQTGRELDMGSPFDFFGPISHHGSDLVTEEQANNRLILRSAMERAGFRAYHAEWWHYTLINEPFPDTYFTFPVR
jgi:D-alanyl-D-alanine dipeptidase